MIPRIPCGPDTRHRPDCPGCMRARELAADTAPNMSTLALELDTPYVPPTASREDELPDQCEVATHRYPLVSVSRSELGVWSLLVLLLRIWVWRWREYRR